MTSLPLFFAQIETLINQPVQKSVSTTVRDTLIVIGCALVLAAILFAGVYFLRKRRTHHHHHYPDPTAPVDAEANTHSRRKSRRRRRKPDHPDKRPRNPTLSETGGLPPMRQETED